MPMRTGVVAVIDALGFKGIWKRSNLTPEEILEGLKGLREIGSSQAKKYVAHDLVKIVGEPRISMLSDTIVVAVGSQGPASSVQVRTQFLSVGIVLCAIVRHAVSMEPALAFRGCIAFGEHLIEDGSFLGPAVDDAAETSEAADAAIIWLHPTALHASQGVELFAVDLNPYIPYTVPMKGGRTFETQAVTPFDRDDGLGTREAFVGRALSTFSSTQTGVQIKRQNTDRFLQICREKVEEQYGVPFF